MLSVHASILLMNADWSGTDLRLIMTRDPAWWRLKLKLNQKHYLKDFKQQLSNYLTKNDSLRKVEGESLLTPINSSLTGERPRMDRDVLPQSVQKQEVTRVPVLFMLDILWYSLCRTHWPVPICVWCFTLCMVFYFRCYVLRSNEKYIAFSLSCHKIGNMNVFDLSQCDFTCKENTGTDLEQHFISFIFSRT